MKKTNTQILFRTTVDFKSDTCINLDSKIFFIGSCFTENIGYYLKNIGMEITVNPTGIVYNPISTINSINTLLDNKKFKDSDFFLHEGVWKSYELHSKFAMSSKESTIDNINNSILEKSKLLKGSDFLFITLGTAWVYELIEENKIVANCQKQPDYLFKRRLLEVDEIVNNFKDLFGKIKKFNRDIKIIFTISPIRHLKDGAYGNQVSKSILHVAVHKLIEMFDYVSYFPSYEIVMDELRDYRFYEDDMIHISSSGINYIIQKFKDSYMSTDTKDKINIEEKRINSMRHRKLFNK